MAGSYVVKSGSGDIEKGVIDFTSKECISNMVQTWLFAKETGFTTNGYIIFPNARVCGSYSSTAVGISVKFNYPTDFNILTDIITTYSTSTKITGYNLKTPNKIREANYTYWNGVFNHESIYISEDVECKYPEIKKHFGKWHDYRDLRYIDVIKYPAQNNENIFTDYIIMKQVYNNSQWLRALALKNPSKVCINAFDTAPQAKLQTAAEYICSYTHSIGYDQSIKLSNEYTDNPSFDWNFTNTDAVLNGIAFTTCDILYADDTVAIKANCTIDEVIQKE